MKKEVQRFTCDIRSARSKHKTGIVQIERYSVMDSTKKISSRVKVEMQEQISIAISKK